MTNEGVGTRLDTYIDIPLEIGLPHFISEDSGSDQGFEPNFTNFKMSLQSVICHRGKSLGAGHYISLARSQKPADTTRRGRSADTSWLRFDDLAKERITTVNIHKALKDECPYLLFYQVQPVDDDDEDFDPDDRGNPPTYDEATVNGSITDNTLSPTESATDTASATTLSSIPSDLTGPPQKSLLDIGLDTIQDNRANSTDTTGILMSSEPVRPPLHPVPSSKSLPSMLDVGLAAKAEQRANSTDTTDTLKEADAIPTLLTQSPTLASRPDELSIAAEQPRPNSMSLVGLDKEMARKSLDIPRGRTSFQGSERRSSVAFTDNDSSMKGGSSAPLTPGDETEAKSSYLSASRRNSVSKAWRRSKSSRPASQSGENRLSLGSRLKSAMSKDKLLSSTTQSSTTDELPPSDASQSKIKSGSIRRKKSTRHGHNKKPHQDKVGAETEDRQCSIM
jgi:hypothetical protein